MTVKHREDQGEVTTSMDRLPESTMAEPSEDLPISLLYG